MKIILFLLTFATGIIFLGLGLAQKPESSVHIIINSEPTCNFNSYLQQAVSWAAPEDLLIKEHSTKKPQLIKPQIYTWQKIKPGQTLHKILRKQQISEKEISLLAQKLSPHLDPRDIAPGDLFKFKKNKKNNLTDFIIKKSNQNRIPITYKLSRKINKKDINFNLEIKNPNITEKIDFAKIVVAKTLYGSFKKITYGNDLMQRLINIFAWKLPMPKNVNRGDIIELIIIKKFVEDELVGYGKIQSARYHKKSRTYNSFLFESQDKKIAGYFDETGKSLEKEFRLSPLYESTATSQQKWRFHPIKKRRVRHNGIDFRGPIGTKFFAIADGEVIAKRFDTNVGNMIRVRHKYNIFSEYFHADTIHSQLKVGSLVSRGQYLGTIGETGRLCTGPHLHLGIYKKHKKKKKFITLTKLKELKPAPDILPNYKNEFSKLIAKRIAFLNNRSSTSVAQQ